MRNKYWKDGIMGLVVGDALGVPVQFMLREEIAARPSGKVVGMEAGGEYDMPAGTWSDDSSMALATLCSINEIGEIDLTDIMNRFVDWLSNGTYTPHGKAFDQGKTTVKAIMSYSSNPNVSKCGEESEHSNGNGSLMRILPACLYYYEKQINEGVSDSDVIDGIHKVSGLTHNHLRSKICCGFYYFMVRSVINGMPDNNKNSSGSENKSSSTTSGDKNLILMNPRDFLREIELKESTKTLLHKLLQRGIDDAVAFYGQRMANYTETSLLLRIFNLAEFQNTPVEEINSSGYVIDSIEAAVWCLITTLSYKECMLKAVNLGEDTDTIAAIAGGLAGIYYGYDAIPKEWLMALQRREWVEGCVEG